MALSGRTFITTTKSYAGLALENVQEGNVICVLFGGRVPCALRPKMDTIAYWANAMSTASWT